MAYSPVSGKTVAFCSNHSTLNALDDNKEEGIAKIHFTTDGDIVLNGHIFGLRLLTNFTEEEAKKASSTDGKELFLTSDTQKIVFNKQVYGGDSASIEALQEDVEALQEEDTNLQEQITKNKNDIASLTETVEEDAEVKAEALSDLDIRTSNLEAVKGRTTYKITINGNSSKGYAFDGSATYEDLDITAKKLGIDSAFQLIGNCSLEITITPKFTPDSIDRATGMVEGDFARVGDTLYIYHNSAWHDITGVNDYTNYTPTFDKGSAGSTQYGIVKFLNADGDEKIQAIYQVTYKTPDQTFSPQKGWVFTDSSNKEWYFGADLMWHEYGDSGSYALKANTYTKQEVHDLINTNIEGLDLEVNVAPEVNTIQLKDLNGEQIDSIILNKASTVNAGLISAVDQAKLNTVTAGAEPNAANTVIDADYVHITVDSALSSSSTNPVQNKAIYKELNSMEEEISACALDTDVVKGVKVSTSSLTKDSNGIVTIPLANQGTDGAMSSSLYQKLESITEGANVVDSSYVHTDNNYTTAEKTRLGAMLTNEKLVYSQGSDGVVYASISGIDSTGNEDSGDDVALPNADSSHTGFMTATMYNALITCANQLVWE